MNRQVIIFVAVIAGVLLLLYFGLNVLRNPVLLAVILFIIVGGATFFPRYAQLKEYERAVVFRFGKFNRVSGPGVDFFIPSIESHQIIDLRTQTIDTAPQEVITKDNIKVKIDAIVYLKIVDPKKSVIEVKDYKTAVIQLLLSRIREVVNRMPLDEVLAKTEQIDTELGNIIKKAALDWGITVLRIEIQSIELPQSLVDAMQKRKEAVELRARVETEAEAKRTAIDILDKAASKMSDTTLSYLYLDALKKISEGKSNKIIFPLEMSHLATLLSGKLEKKKEAKEGASPFEETVKSLLDAYTEKKRQMLESEEKPTPKPSKRKIIV